MEQSRIIQGRRVTVDDIRCIRQLISAHPDWHRTRLSRELSRQWHWVAANGQLKDMAARSLLRKLDAEGAIRLPPPIRSSHNAFKHRAPATVEVDCTPLIAPLSALRPLAIRQVATSEHRELLGALLQRYHYLGYSGPVGEHLAYLMFDRRERPLGCALFGAPAWRVVCRDRFIGWDEEARRQGLSNIANQARFLVLPWVRVPHLASHLLGQFAQRVSAHWQERYGHPLALLETYVEQGRFAGTCYRAANWIRVGETAGRSRNDRTHRLEVPVKAVWLYPLSRHFRERLSAPGCPS
jgi:hypothetical protein